MEKVRPIDVQIFTHYYLLTLQVFNPTDYSKYKIVTNPDTFVLSYQDETLVEGTPSSNVFYGSDMFQSIIKEPYYKNMLSLDMQDELAYIQDVLPRMLNYFEQHPLRHLNYPLLSTMKTIYRLGIHDIHPYLKKYQNTFIKASTCPICGGKLLQYNPRQEEGLNWSFADCIQKFQCKDCYSIHIKDI